MTNSTPYQTHKPIGKRLWALALEWSAGGEFPGTQAARDAAIKALRGRKKVISGSRSVRAAREAVEAAAADIREARKARQARRSGLRRIIRASARLPVGSLHDRLQARVERDIIGFVEHFYRTDSAGTLRVGLTHSPAGVGVRQSDFLDWDYYSKSTKYPKTIVNTTITVPSNWWGRVRDNSLATTGGMLTLDAQRLEGTPDGVALYAAVWIEQGRGYNLRDRQGYIAVGMGESYHADTVEKAMSGLRRKVGLRKADAGLVDLLARHGLSGIAERHPDLAVTVADARVTGACEYGIRSWCARTGLDYEAGTATLSAVYQAYRDHPLPEARAAILHALRRQRRAVLKAA